MLPEALRPWLEDISERMQCPLDYPAVGALVALSSVIGRQIAVRPRRRDNWTVVPNLWGAVVGRPGVMKSPALAEAIKPLEILDSRARIRYEHSQRDHKVNYQLAEVSDKLARENIRKAMKTGNRQEAEKLAQAQWGTLVSPLKRQRYMTSDTTVEALGELLAANPRGILLYRDELMGWLKDLDREGRESSRAFYLEAWNGNGRFTFDRIGRGTIDIDAACVSILGGIQPGKLEEYMQGALQGGSADDGLIQRFQLLVHPDTSPHYYEVDCCPDAEAQRMAYGVYERLDQLEGEAIGANTDQDIPYLRLDEEAYERFVDWRKSLEDRIRTATEHPAFESVLAKQRSLVPSLALIFHLVDNPTGGPVTDTALLLAIQWCEFLELHARRLYAPKMDSALHAAIELDHHIRRGHLSPSFTTRDVYRRGWHLLDRKGTIEALERLEELGRVFSVKAETGGRPTTTWHVHPDLTD